MTWVKHTRFEQHGRCMCVSRRSQLTRSRCEDRHGFFHGSVRGRGEDTWEEETQRNSDSFFFLGRCKEINDSAVIVFLCAFSSDVEALGDLFAGIIVVNHLLGGSMLKVQAAISHFSVQLSRL